MGEPMALNLVKNGTDLLVWNRSAPARERLHEAGASVAGSAREAIEASKTIILMLANGDATDDVLEREAPQFEANVRGRTIVQMGTTSPRFSAQLEADIRLAGGTYIEAPVSGSRKPAEDARLVIMLAGTQPYVDHVRELVAPLCTASFFCGSVPNALVMKLAVNLFLITMVTGLVEASHFAANHGLELELFRDIVSSGPMASDVSRVKLAKLVATDFSSQASLRDVLMNNALVADAARLAKIATPLLDQSHQLYAEAIGMGLGDLDMVAVLGAYEELTAWRRMSPVPADRSVTSAEGRPLRFP
jgi:3-hydroxyisobutyrate dehydrogenase